LAQGASSIFKQTSRQWFEQSIALKYSYHFNWMGLPIIQYPQDMIAVQQIIWETKPDVIIETGIARGGSLIFHASLLELNATCGAAANAKVVGIDIDIREKNRNAINEHPMAPRIKMIEGSSVDLSVVEQVAELTREASSVMVCLDSNHSHDHVFKELEIYAPLVTENNYLVVFDTIIEALPEDLSEGRPWSPGNSPQTAVRDYLRALEKDPAIDKHGKVIRFKTDTNIDNRLMLSVAPNGYLRRVCV
jgi:cephalosporin hydroxylase